MRPGTFTKLSRVAAIIPFAERRIADDAVTDRTRPEFTPERMRRAAEKATPARQLSVCDSCLTRKAKVPVS